MAFAHEKYTGDLQELGTAVDDLVFDTDSNWIRFFLKGYKVSAKVFSEPSDYGINKGRISKMTVHSPQSVLVYHYDRGEDLNPSSKGAKDIVDEIVRIFKNGE